LSPFEPVVWSEFSVLDADSEEFDDKLEAAA
jgi:hypothetical protein